MKRFLASIFLFLFIPVAAHAQYASRIMPRAADPSVCNPANGDVYFNTTSFALRQCIAANTWQNIGLSGSGLTIPQGTLTADIPAINTTATWNNGAVTFNHWFANVTDTASGAGSSLLVMQVGGVERFSVSKNGNLYLTGGAYVGADAALGITTRALVTAPANGVVLVSNNAMTGLTRLTLGPNTIAGTGLIPEVVGGQTQGFVIGNGDGTTLSFAELAAAANGTIVYCDDCTKATPCAAAGTGALAKRYNGAWDCD